MGEALDEAYELLEDLPPMEISSDEIMHQVDEYDLDCGAILQISTDVIEIPEEEDDGGDGTIFATIKDYFCPEVYATTKTQNCDTTKGYSKTATVIGAGTVSIKITTNIKASSDGIRITSVSRKGTVTLHANKKSTACKIVDSSALKVGNTCKSKAGIKYTFDIEVLSPVGFIHIIETSPKWKNIICTFELKSKSKNGVTFEWTAKGTTSDKWS